MEEDSEVENTASMTLEPSILKEFILMFESLPELWDSTSPSYVNKTKRKAALVKLLGIYKKIKTDCTISDVRKKINSLRSNYRKELKKIILSKRSGAATDDIYTPKAWTFYCLQFLDRTEQPVDSTASLKRKQENDEVEQDVARTSIEPQSSCSGSFSSIQITPQPVPAKQKKTGPIARQNELMEKACILLAAPPPSISTSIALVWAEKLNKLDSTQRFFAEKAINDILFEAELGTLNRQSVQINQFSDTNHFHSISPAYSPSNNNSTTISSTPNTNTVDTQYIDLNTAQIEMEEQPRTTCTINNLKELFSTYSVDKD